MLKSLSRLRHTQRYLLVAFALLLVLPLILFYAPTRGGADSAELTPTTEIAEVGSDSITVGELRQATESLQQRFGGSISIAQLGGPRRLLDGLIEGKVAALEARERGLGVSDEEVSDAVRKTYVNSNGRFLGVERYRQIVTSQFGDVGRFEDRLRQDLAGEKLRAFLTAGVRVSDDEVQNEYKRDNTTFNLVYVPVTVDRVAARLQPSDADLQSYYDRNKESFRIDVPQKKITYLFVDTAKAGAKLDIPDADLRGAYDRLSEDRKLAGVRVQQIILRVARPDLDAGVREQAETIVRDLRSRAGENGAIGQDAFAEAARGKSEDPATAREGGFLAGVVRRDPNKATDPLQQVFTLEAGQITDPTKVGNAYVIYRRGDGVPQSFEDKRQELLVSERNRRAYATAQSIAARGVEMLRQTKDVRAVAQQLAPQANMTPDEMVRETGYIKSGDDVPDIGVNQDFEGVIAPLDETGEVGDRIGIKNGLAVPVLTDQRPPRVPELAEVRDQVTARVKDETARGRLEAVAGELASGATDVESLRARAAALGLEPQTADDFKLGSPLGSAGTSPAADAAVFNLTENQVTRQPVKINDTYVVIAAAKRTEADLAEFAKQRETLTQSAISERQSQVYGDFIAAARRRMEQNGEIEIHKETLDRLAEEIDASAPALAPGFPPGLGGAGGGLPFPPNG